MGSDTPELTVSYIQANAETVRTPADRRWILWIFQNIMLWKMVGVWPAPVARAHFAEIWHAFLALRETCDPVFLLIDTDDFAQQSYQFRDMLVKEWSHVLDRNDLVICLVATDPMRRAVRNTMAMLAGKLERFRFYKSFEAALRFIEHRRRGPDGGTETSLRTIGDVVGELSRGHDRLAEQYEQDMLESEIVGDLERRFQAMFQEFPAPVYYFDLWGRFAWGNARAEAAFGCAMDDLVGVPYFESRLATFDDLVQAARMLAGRFQHPPSWPVEFSVMRHDGTRSRLEVAAQLTSFGPKTVILCVATDLAARESSKSRAGKGADRAGVLCPRCHRIRDASGRWLAPELFHRVHHALRFKRSVCPTCAEKAEDGAAVDESASTKPGRGKPGRGQESPGLPEPPGKHEDWSAGDDPEGREPGPTDPA